MRRNGRARDLYGQLCYAFQPSNVHTSTVADAPATNKGKGGSSIEAVSGAICSGNLTDTGVPRGVYSSVAGVFSGGRYYQSAAGDRVFAIEEYEDFTISVLCTSHWTMDRSFTIGFAQSNGGIGTFAVGAASGGERRIFLAPGNGNGPNLTWRGPDNVKNDLQRYDLCRVNGVYFAFFDGVLNSLQNSQGSHIHGGKMAIGGLGEYQTSNGGGYGDRWKGPVEEVVLLKGIGLFTASFQPFAEHRPFRRGRLRR